MDEGSGFAASMWVLLSYRVPREPSTPRIAVWRALRRLGVAQIGDGLVALPADARTQEQLEWVAGQVVEAAGTATVWRATMTSRASERVVVKEMAAARAAEYQAVGDRARSLAGSPAVDRGRAVASLRRELRQVTRRDFFPPPEREEARALVEHLAGDARSVAREERST